MEIYGNKILWKRGAISPVFHNIFNISLSSEVKLHIHKLNVAVQFIVFLTSAALIFRVFVEVLRPSQPNGVMSRAVSLPNHMFTGQA